MRKNIWNGSGKILNYNEFESVTGGEIGDPILGKCTNCGKPIQVGKEGVNLSMSKICEDCQTRNIATDISHSISKNEFF